MSCSSMGRVVMRPAIPGSIPWVTVARPTARRSAPDPSDPEVAARRAAALAEVRMWGDPVLRTVARPVERFDADLRAQADRMAQLMDDALGAGLAANQVGMLSRLLVYRSRRTRRCASSSTPRSSGRPTRRSSSPRAA